MATSAPSREEMLAQLRIVRELGERTPGTYLGHRDDVDPSDVVLETYAHAPAKIGELARKLMEAPPHPHIVKVLAADRIGDGISIVSEFVEGVPLDEVFFGLSLGGRLRAVVDVLAALSALHTFELVHGGVLRRSSFVESTGRTKLGFVYRQPLCIKKDTYAPEALLGDTAAIGPRSDVYGAGVMLWEAVTGRVLFGNDAPEKIVRTQLAGRIEQALPPKSDRWARTLLPVIERALAVDPAERFANVAEMAAALRIAVRARLMMHEDVVEEIWPAETKPKHSSGIVPVAGPAVAPAVVAEPVIEAEPELELEAEPEPEPESARAEGLTMESERPAEGAASGIVPIETPAPVVVVQPKRAGALRPLLLACAVVAVVVAGLAAYAMHARAPAASAARPELTAPHAAPRAAAPAVATTAKEADPSAKPGKPAPAADHAVPAHPQHKATKHHGREVYDPSSI